MNPNNMIEPKKAKKGNQELKMNSFPEPRFSMEYCKKI